MTEVNEHEHQITFRRLRHDDLLMMHGWLNEPGVVRWWEGDDVTYPAVERDYGPGNTGSTENWIAILDGEPVGWICCWPVLDGLSESRPWFGFGVEETAAGIDYLVAAPHRRGQGIGSAMIRSFCSDVVFGRHDDWTQAAAGPYTSNVASWKALENAGFTFAGSVQHAGDGDAGPCTLMILARNT